LIALADRHAQQEKMAQVSKFILLPVEIVEQIFANLTGDWYVDQYGKRCSWIYCPHPDRNAGRDLMNFRLIHPQLAIKSQRIFYKTILEWICYSARRYRIVRAIAEHTQARQHVIRLDFGPERGCKLNPTHIAGTMAQFEELEWLSVRRIPISIQALNNPKLRQFHLNMEYYNGKHCINANDFTKFLGNHPTLEYLLAYSLELTSGSAIQILEAARKLHHLRMLILVFANGRTERSTVMYYPFTIWHSSFNDRTDLQQLYTGGHPKGHYSAEGCKGNIWVGAHHCAVGTFSADPEETRTLIDVVIKKYYELVEAHKNQERERLERERLEKERLERERLEHERLAKERLKQERLLQQERLEKENLAKRRPWKPMVDRWRLVRRWERLEKDKKEKESQKRSNGTKVSNEETARSLKTRPLWRIPSAR
jgi:hypothetical protein